MKDLEDVAELLAKARAAQTRFAFEPRQERYDLAASAAAWAVLEPARNAKLSRLAVETTGLGRVEDKIAKNHRKTLGLLRDIKGQPTCGVVGENSALGIIEIARPVGVVGAIVPSTNPVATPVNNIINALKGGNAIVVAPSPKGADACAALIGCIHAEFDKVGLDRNLVSMLPRPIDKAKTQALLEACDLAVVTGSQDNVRRAYMSGTPAIGVGAGNVSVIVDETADIAAAAKRIAASKTFDNATSCSSENAVIVVEAVRQRFLEALSAEGGVCLDAPNAERLKTALFQNGRLNRAIVARDAECVVAEAGLENVDPRARFFLVEAGGIGPEHPESGEKLSLVAALYTVPDFEAAVTTAEQILNYQGKGHSVGLHSTSPDRALGLGARLPVCRVIVNQAHCFATGGSFDNGLPFSLSMGCGTWGGNSIDENLHWRHFINITRISRPIAPREPALEELLGDYWKAAGR